MKKTAAPGGMNSVVQTAQKIGQSRTEVYRLIGRGHLAAFKAGRRTLVSDESIARYVASLPAAVINVK